MVGVVLQSILIIILLEFVNLSVLLLRFYQVLTLFVEQDIVKLAIFLGVFIDVVLFIWVPLFIVCESTEEVSLNFAIDAVHSYLVGTGGTLCSKPVHQHLAI